MIIPVSHFLQTQTYKHTNTIYTHAKILSLSRTLYLSLPSPHLPSCPPYHPLPQHSLVLFLSPSSSLSHICYNYLMHPCLSLSTPPRSSPPHPSTPLSLSFSLSTSPYLPPLIFLKDFRKVTLKKTFEEHHNFLSKK